MKYLTQYIEKAQTKAFDEAGAFFAFSDKQFEEQKKEGIKYISLGSGLITPEKNAKSLIDNLDNILSKGIAEDVAENKIKGVIKRELANHEAYYTGDIEDTCEALEAYGITKAEILEVFREERKNHND